MSHRAHVYRVCLWFGYCGWLLPILTEQTNAATTVSEKDIFFSMSIHVDKNDRSKPQWKDFHGSLVVPLGNQLVAAACTANVPESPAQVKSQSGQTQSWPMQTVPYYLWYDGIWPWHDRDFASVHLSLPCVDNAGKVVPQRIMAGALTKPMIYKGGDFALDHLDWDAIWLKDANTFLFHRDVVIPKNHLYACHVPNSSNQRILLRITDDGRECLTCSQDDLKDCIRIRLKADKINVEKKNLPAEWL